MFDSLLQNNVTRILDHKVIPSPRDLEKQEYCKWHNCFDHSTSNCNIFRQIVQSAIDKGRLSFSESKRNDQFAEIGHNGEMLSNRLLQADSCKIEEWVVDKTYSMPSEETSGTGGSKRSKMVFVHLPVQICLPLMKGRLLRLKLTRR